MFTPTQETGHASLRPRRTHRRRTVDATAAPVAAAADGVLDPAFALPAPGSARSPQARRQSDVDRDGPHRGPRRLTVHQRLRLWRSPGPRVHGRQVPARRLGARPRVRDRWRAPRPGRLRSRARRARPAAKSTLAPNGTLVVPGRRTSNVSAPVNTQAAIQRYTALGAPDATFSAGGVRHDFSFFTTHISRFSDAVVNPDESVIAVGDDYQTLSRRENADRRYTRPARSTRASPCPTASFTSRSPPARTTANGTCVIRQPDGELVLLGISFGSHGTITYVRRISASGTPDATFGGGSGLVVLQLSTVTPAIHRRTSGYGLALGPDGSIVVGASVTYANLGIAGDRYQQAIVKLDAVGRDGPGVRRRRRGVRPVRHTGPDRTHRHAAQRPRGELRRADRHRRSGGRDQRAHRRARHPLSRQRNPRSGVRHRRRLHRPVRQRRPGTDCLHGVRRRPDDDRLGLLRRLRQRTDGSRPRPDRPARRRQPGAARGPADAAGHARQGQAAGPRHGQGHDGVADHQLPGRRPELQRRAGAVVAARRPRQLGEGNDEDEHPQGGRVRPDRVHDRGRPARGSSRSSSRSRPASRSGTV